MSFKTREPADSGPTSATVATTNDVTSTPVGTASPYDAVIFGMEGVVSDTASVRAASWKSLFDQVLSDPRAAPATGQPAFDEEEDYRRYLDGRAPEVGIAAFLNARGVAVPLGSAGDAPDAWTVHGFAEYEDSIFLDLLGRRGARVFEGTVALLRRLRAGGVATALVTATSDASALLARAGMKDMFDVVVCPDVVAAVHISPEPDPAMFLEAARQLGVPPGWTAVVDDDIAGVEAAHRAGFALVVGINRSGRRRALEEAGADLVLQDVAELDLGVLRVDPWLLAYDGFDPAHEGHREALTTVGNGYFGTRGAAPECRADAAHYPGTYLAGVYNRLDSTVQGRYVEDEHMVNAPNWLMLDLRIGDGEWWSAGGLTVHRERRGLDLHTGVLTRHALLRDHNGRHLRITQRRLVSMSRPHLAALETLVIAEGWSGPVTVRSGIDAGITNDNVAEYRGLANRHLDKVTARPVGTDILLVMAETSQSRIQIATAARTTIIGARHADPSIETDDTGWYAQQFDVSLEDGQPVLIDKTVALVTSRDPAVASPELGAVDQISSAPGGFEALLPSQRIEWRELWSRFGIGLETTDRQSQLVLNLHVFHLLQTISPHTAGLDAGVPARGLHGEGYRGHVFWDELFVLPVVTAHLPAVTRSLLDYRWRRLDAARHAARSEGLLGARFPWQSGSDGREETPALRFNLRSGRWISDNSRRQTHVGLAIAYDAWQYYQTTGDLEWLAARGGELIIEVARLFTSMASYDPKADRFHIAGVMGPDEYHDGYPETPGEGVHNNAYTNVLASWVCRRAAQILDLLAGHVGDELTTRLDVKPHEPTDWAHLSCRLTVPFHDGIISQFDGYDKLAELDWARYRSTYGNIERLDLILEAEDDSTNRYRLAKQADVLMLIYLLGPDELLAVLEHLGYPTTDQVLADTVEFYLARTVHGSTLSRVVHASVLARVDPSRAWDEFRAALAADLDDTQGGTTKEGIHLGAIAGTIDLVTRAFSGMQIRTDVLTFTPRLPEELHRARFQIHYRGQRIDVSVDHQRLRLTAQPCAGTPAVHIDVAGVHQILNGGQTLEFVLV